MRSGRPLAVVTPLEWKRGFLSPRSLCSTPGITPLLIITAAKRKREEGVRQLLHNMLSIKSAEVDWDLGGCGGRLGEQGWIYAVYPALPVCVFFFHLRIPSTRWNTFNPY